MFRHPLRCVGMQAPCFPARGLRVRRAAHSGGILAETGGHGAGDYVVLMATPSSVHPCKVRLRLGVQERTEEVEPPGFGDRIALTVRWRTIFHGLRLHRRTETKGAARWNLPAFPPVRISKKPGRCRDGEDLAQGGYCSHGRPAVPHGLRCDRRATAGPDSCQAGRIGGNRSAVAAHAGRRRDYVGHPPRPAQDA